MANLMINEFLCEPLEVESNPSPFNYVVVYSLANEFDYVGGIEIGDEITSENGSRLRVIDMTYAIFKNPDTSHEKDYLDTVQKISGVLKRPQSQSQSLETDEEESAAPNAN